MPLKRLAGQSEKRRFYSEESSMKVQNTHWAHSSNNNSIINSMLTYTFTRDPSNVLTPLLLFTAILGTYCSHFTNEETEEWSCIQQSSDRCHLPKIITAGLTEGWHAHKEERTERLWDPHLSHTSQLVMSPNYTWHGLGQGARVYTMGKPTSNLGLSCPRQLQVGAPTPCK